MTRWAPFETSPLSFAAPPVPPHPARTTTNTAPTRTSVFNEPRLSQAHVPIATNPNEGFTHVDMGIYDRAVARSSTTSDVFNAIAEGRRREILDSLIAGEKAVGTIVEDVALSQPQVSKHLRVLSEVGLVTCRAEGRRRLYSLEPERLRPMREWLAKHEQALNERLDRMDDYLKQLQAKESGSDT
jgi:DNA-binding transcriptional ArsR family regulator